ncbi:MAG: acyl-CoA synthetase [Roseovarius sp.]|nr:acyl-CoA synthetase [Roseovarius sp.]
MEFVNFQNVRDIENEMSWDEREKPKTIYGMIKETARANPSGSAISYQLLSGPKDKAETLTWQEFHAGICQAANLFRRLGVKEGDVVAMVLPNCIETATAIFGGMIAGIAAPVNPLLEAGQIAAILRETGAKVVVTLMSFPKTDIAQKVSDALLDAPDVQTVLEIDLNRYLSPPKKWIVPLVRPKNPVGHKAKVLDYVEETSRQNSSLDFEDAKGDRVGVCFHTGGTTGMPKVVQNRYSGLIYNGWLGENLLPITENETIMCPLPLFHTFAASIVMMLSFKAGLHVVFPTPAGYRGDGVFDNFWKLCERWKATFVMTVPTAVSQKMQRPVNADISTVKNAFSGSAPMPLELFNRFGNSTGMTVIEGYGLTEVTGLVSCNPPTGEKKVGSVGFSMPYTDVRIYNETPDGPVECAADEIGEICIASPGVYDGNTYTDPDKNVNLFYFGKYLRTGDLGRIDADGYLWITGRIKDLIIRGGHNIDPAIVEDALMANDNVAVAAAIGQPDNHAGEVPCAYVELVEGSNASSEGLMEFCQGNIPERAAIPRHLEIMDELPKTAVGKVFKPDLRKMAITRIYDEALRGASVNARVAEVVDTKKHGMVAMLEKTGNIEDREVANALGGFTRPWEWAGNQ